MFAGPKSASGVDRVHECVVWDGLGTDCESAEPKKATSIGPLFGEQNQELRRCPSVVAGVFQLLARMHRKLTLNTAIVIIRYWSWIENCRERVMVAGSGVVFIGLVSFAHRGPVSFCMARTAVAC